jgi:1-acyl-sn-glycerol-3-phosphate acyltransferase
MFAYRHFAFLQWFTGLFRSWKWLRWQVSGLDNLPACSSGFVLVVNHITWTDIWLVAATLPLTHIPHWLAKAELFGPVTGWWFRGMQAIPVRRGQSDSTAMDQAVAALKAGHILIVFPEGSWGKGAVAQSGWHCVLGCPSCRWHSRVSKTESPHRLPSPMARRGNRFRRAASRISTPTRCKHSPIR